MSERAYRKLRAAASEGQLHGGVRGAHPQNGGIETPQADLEKDDTRFGADARFTMGPEGRDSMWAGGPPEFAKAKPHVDTAPYARRPAEQGTQLPLGTEGAFKPSDVATHFVRLKHPHLTDFSFEHGGSDHFSHMVTAYHEGNEVASLHWNGSRSKRIDEDTTHAPGEIEGVKVHPDYRGKGLGTALWDYARVKVATEHIQEPVHSADRSTAGNHWAHFVGGATMARTSGQDVPEYFDHEWR